MSNQRAWGWVDHTTLDEQSIALALDGILSLAAESIVNGTKACRAIIVGQSGIKRTSNYKGRLPLTIDLANKIARYMGSSDGKWKSANAIDIGSNNHITDFYDINHTWRNDAAYDALWASNVIWASSYNRDVCFYPALQTVYGNDSSILNDLKVVAAACQVTKAAYRCWTNLSGNSYDTDTVFLQKSTDSISKQLDGAFDHRMVIVPNSFFTEQDKERGYSWTCEISILSPMMRTVGTYSIIVEKQQ